MIKSILDKTLQEAIIQRVQKLEPNFKPAWGTMTAFQMVKHCRLFEEWILGIGEWDYSISRSTPTQAAEALADISSGDTPLMRFAPSSEILIVNEQEGDFDLELTLWIDHLKRYENYSNPSFVHDFFGKMTAEQIGILAFKHSDHHLRQFGV
jgi:Protein of unknown function (DUF1569)